MDNIRSTLCILFSQQNGSKIIDSVKQGYPGRFLDQFVNEDWFCRCFREKYNIYTYDQIVEIFKILNTNWLNKYDTPTARSFAEKSVFNVLLNYSQNILVERQQVPICKYSQLFRWHLIVGDLGEDIFTTSFFAAKDITLCYTRKMFSWDHCIEHDNVAINHILERPVADLHFHLKGSSINFDLNWLSLMNSIIMRKKEFDELNNLQSPSIKFMENEILIDDLYTAVSRACLIRYMLFAKLIDYLSSSEELHIWNLLQSNSEWHTICAYIEPKLSTIKHIYGKSYRGHKVDYAIPNNLTCNEIDNQNKYRNSVLSGERWLMYNMFRKIYSDDQSFKKYAPLFYVYLVEKNRLRHELIQLNQKIGFANFAQYEGRKELFIRDGSVYQKLIAHQAVHNSVKNQKENYVEVRITPKDSTVKLYQSIKEIDNNVLDRSFLSPSIPDYNINLTNYHYVLHFIKTKDKIEKGFACNLFPRSHKLRSKVRIQAIAIARVRDFSNKTAQRIVGIDAANTEIGCRPEIFAQAFRYLKYHPVKQDLEYIKSSNQQKLGCTYHAGEDYMDIADGLRAIDEAIKFLNLTDGDRIGHALALGVDVKTYYLKQNYTIIMSLQDFLDNTVWIWEKIRSYRIASGYSLLYRLEQWYEICFMKIFERSIYLFKNQTIPSIYSYYQFWLLRGDNPAFYSKNQHQQDSLQIGYDQYAFNKYSEEIQEARNNQDARTLFYLYHFDEKVKINGGKTEQWKVDTLYQSTIHEIQSEMYRNIEKQHIFIETNPTSNYRIGALNKYMSHPITRFFNHGINTNYPHSQISVSINTDDLGIFNTCIEREFSLIALALEKNKEIENNPRSIYDWLDYIRETAFEQRFFS